MIQYTKNGGKPPCPNSTIILIILAAVLLTSCAGPSQELPVKPTANTPANPSPGETLGAAESAEPTGNETGLSGELTFTGGFVRQLNDCINLFKKEHPNVTFNLTETDFDYLTYATNVATDFMSGGGDDIIMTVASPFYSYASKGMFVDLTEFIDNVPGMWEDFYPEALEWYTYDDKLYALPNSIWALGYKCVSRYASEVHLFEHAQICRCAVRKTETGHRDCNMSKALLRKLNSIGH